ncbi:hypothetical protein NQ779_18835, partial [Acinetobacter baumannii]|nr:hypothetical protein [Acinetobacter baumannii]
MKQLYDVFDIAKNQPLVQAEKVLKPETIIFIRKAEEVSVHGCYILDRWATYQPMELKQLEEQGDLILFNRLYDQQDVELKILNHPNYYARSKYSPVRVSTRTLSTGLELLQIQLRDFLLKHVYGFYELKRYEVNS